MKIFFYSIWQALRSRVTCSKLIACFVRQATGRLCATLYHFVDVNRYRVLQSPEFGCRVFFLPNSKKKGKNPWLLHAFMVRLVLCTWISLGVHDQI